MNFNNSTVIHGGSAPGPVGLERPGAIVFVIDCWDRMNFFLRVQQALASEKSFFFTTEPAVYLALKARRKKVYLARRHLSAPRVPADFSPEECIEVANGVISARDAAIDAGHIIQRLSTLNKLHQIKKFVLWNGNQILCRSVEYFARSANCPVQFLEIANLPSKIFSDPVGVNAKSSIAIDISIIDRLPLPRQEIHLKWLEKYEEEKAKPLPQARIKKIEKLINPINKGIKILTGGIVKLNKKKIANTNQEETIIPLERDIPSRYIFLPLQVSTDTQLKFNSNVDNIEAINYASDLARQRGLDLVVKIHPAERDSHEKNRIHKASTSVHAYISNRNTIDLIKGADVVVTINSTVGIESLLYRKELIVLGRAFFKEFDQDRIKKYVHYFLIDGVDYFGNAPIPLEIASRMIGLSSETQRI